MKSYAKPERNPVLSMGFWGASRYWKDRAHKAEDECERLEAERFDWHRVADERSKALIAAQSERDTLAHQLKQAKKAAERAREDAETRCGEPGA